MYSDRMKTRMDELNAQKTQITASLADLELSTGFKLTRDHIAFFLRQFRDADMTDRNCQKRLIQTFVNSVFVYDDKLKIVFNYTADSNTVTLETIENLDIMEDGSGFVCSTECSTTITVYELFKDLPDRWIVRSGEQNSRSKMTGKKRASTSIMK